MIRTHLAGPGPGLVVKSQDREPAHKWNIRDQNHGWSLFQGKTKWTFRSWIQFVFFFLCALKHCQRFCSCNALKALRTFQHRNNLVTHLLKDIGRVLRYQ